MAQKLRTCKEQEVQQLFTGSMESRTESQDTAYQTLDRWLKLDKMTQQKVLSLIKQENVREEVHRLMTHINRLMNTPEIKCNDDKEKGQ